MNPFSSKSNENRQKAPEQRRLSSDATSIFLNNIRPKDYSGRNTLKHIVELMFPEEFVQPQAIEPTFTYQPEQVSPLGQAATATTAEAPVAISPIERPEVIQARLAVQNSFEPQQYGEELQDA